MNHVTTSLLYSAHVAHTAMSHNLLNSKVYNAWEENKASDWIKEKPRNEDSRNM